MIAVGGCAAEPDGEPSAAARSTPVPPEPVPSGLFAPPARTGGAAPEAVLPTRAVPSTAPASSAGPPRSVDPLATTAEQRPQVPVAPDEPAAEPGSTWSAGPAALLAVVALLAGAVGGFATGRRSGRRPPAAVGAGGGPAPVVRYRPAPAPVPAPVAPPAGGCERELVRGLIGSHDLAADDVQRHHVEQVLRAAGVVALRPPPGSPFDAGNQEAVGAVPARTQEEVGLIADTVRAGWADASTVLRPAQVQVYTER
jgi:hypothetical protein